MKKNYQCVLAALFVLLFSNLSFAENEDPCAMPANLTEIEGVYQIGTCGDLYKFAEMVNNSGFDDNIKGELIADICVNACVEGESVLNADGTLNGNGGNFKQWTPMNFLPGYGMFDVQVTLDGNGKTISGLYFDDISTENVGLFGVVTGMVFVSDLGIEDSYFRGEGFVGGLVGLNTSTGTFSITNSYNAGTVIGSDYVGGLVGYSSGTLTITNSYNAGSMNGDGDNVGGLVGYIFYSTLTITNSFFLAAEGVSGEFGGTPKSANEFHIGLVALMLHNYVQTGCGNDCIDGTIWGQNLKNGDLRPNFSSEINVETQELVLHTFEGDTRVYPTEYIAGQELPTGLTREGFVFLGWSSKEVAESSDDIVTSIASDATGKKEFYAQWKAFDDDGCFAIASTVELYAFANVVGSATDGKQICGTLAENIVVNTCDDGKSVLKGDGYLNCSGEKFKQWTPMNVQSGVQVTFNGKGKTISGLYFDNGNKENVGLFGGVYGTVDISNLNIVDSYFKGKNGVGGLVGYSSGENAKLSIANSYNAGSVSGTDNVGGLVGCGKSDTLTITSSYNAGTVAGRYDVGGLVGFNDGGTLTVTNSYNVGAVSGSNVGGLVGANEYFSALTITNSYNAGSVSGSNVGGLVGANEYYSTLTIAHSFFLETGKSGDGLGGELKALDDFHDGTVAALLHYYAQTDCEENCIDGSVWGQDLTNVNSLPDFSGEFAGGTLYALTLYTFDGNARKYPTEYVSEFGFELPTDLVRDGYVFAGWSTKQVSTSMADIVTSIAKGATGAKTFYAQWMKVSEEGVYEIATAADLYKFAQLVNGGATNIKGKLTADICVNACGEGESVLKADGTLNGDGSNFTQWTPIGTETQKFNGTFDGTGHTISGLYVDGVEYAGLFGYVFVDNINGEDEKGVVKNVGIEDSHISGTNYVGGVVAYNEGRTLSVYNAGNVTGSGSGCATGGVVGYNVGLVSDAYNAGAVKSSVNDCSTGGVVGLNAGFVFYVYNIGAVSGGANVGGVAGSNSSMISKAYYNTEVFTGNAVGSGNLPNPAAGKTAVELSSLEIVDLVSDKDHVGSSAWVVGSGRVVMSDNKLVYKLPGLKVFSSQPEIVLMQANDQDVFEIGSAQELKWFAEYAGSGEISINAKLTADICLNACGEGASVLDADGALNVDGDNFEQWTPINTRYGTNVSLDGNGHTISGLYFSNSEQDNVGFFGSLQGTVSISNLGIVDSYFEGKDSVGVFVGVNDYSNLTITNCFGAGYVKGDGYVAGFVGQSKGTLNITNSYSVSIVNGEDYTGSFIGSGAFANVANSFFLNGSSNFGGTQKTANEFHDGTVAVLLHNWCEKDDGSENCKEGGLDGTVWGQDLTNANSLPDFSGEFAGGTLYALTLYTFDGNVRKYPTEYVSEIGFELPTDLVREGYVFAGWSTKQVSTSMADVVTSIAKGATDAKTFYAQWMKVSEEGVYEIATAVDLYKFAEMVNGGATDIKGKLTADICVNACGEGEKSLLEQVAELEANDALSPESFQQWIPIGTTSENKMFKGTFDGAGHTISGLYFNQDASYAGLFGRSTKNNSSKSSIKNVGVVDSYIKGKNNVGGIVGYNGNCTVSNVFSTSTVQGNEYVGGIAGYNDAGTIENAYNMGAVSGNSKVAGIAGYNLGTSAHINNVYSSGTVSGPEGRYVRGLVGYNNESKTKIDNAFYNTDVFSGMAVGNVDGTNVEGKTTVELASTTLPEGFSSEIWLAGSKDVVDGKLVYKFPGLKIFNSQPELVLFNVQKGSDGKDYCEIANADDLFKFAQLVNGGATGLNAKLTADICVNGCGEGEKSLLEQVAELEANDELSPESFQQWTPMSVPENVTLTFDGNGHTISGLYFNKEKSSQIGLFGQVVGDVSVSNLGVVDFYVNGNGEVGSLAGQVTGKLNIKNCYSAGSVKGEHYIGGIVGVNRDVAELKIENSYNESSVNAPSGIVGGLVGENNNYASLTITNSYNAGAVNGNDYVGGLVGDNYSAILTIENSYNAGTVSGDSCVGGLVGVNEDGTLNVLNSFFVETNGDGDGLAGEAKTLDEFANGEVTDLLNTDQSPIVWVQGKEYPILKDNHVHLYENGFCICGNYEQPVQDENGVYQISNAGELYWFADFVNQGGDNANAILTNNIVVNTLEFKDGEIVTDNKDYREWKPIGSAWGYFYKGVFDGNGHTISGLYFNDPDKDYVGLFAYNDGIIKNVGVVDSYFYGKNSVGGVCGYNYYGTIANCFNTSVVSGNNEIGGVSGSNFEGKIENCYNTGAVSGSVDVGEVCGGYNNTFATVSNCYYLSDTDDGVSGKTAEQFADGTVALLLHNWCETEEEDEICKEDGLDGSVWGQNVGQTIGNDAAPTLSGVLKLGPLTVAKDAAGKESAAIDGASALEVKIPADIHVDYVKFNRTFTQGIVATIVLPFDVPSSALPGNAEFGTLKSVGPNSEKGGKWEAVFNKVTELEAHTPYLVRLSSGTSLDFDFGEAGGIIKTTEEYDETSGKMVTVPTSSTSTDEQWELVGTYSYKSWQDGDPGIGSTYGFAGSAEGEEVAAGQFVKVGAGAYINPMRVYLQKVTKVNPGRRALGNASVLASIPEELPEYIDVVFVDSDDAADANEVAAGSDSAAEKTTYIGRINTRTGAIELKRTYDAKGRMLNSKPTAKGNYFNKKVIK